MPTADLPALTAAIGENVRRLRERRGLTQAALAETCSVEPAHLQRVEYGSTVPSLRLLHRLGEALEVEVWQLVKPPRRIANPGPRRRGRPPKRSS